MTKIMNGHVAPLNCPVKNHRFHLKYFNFGLYAILAVLGFLYLINISDLTVSGFTLRDLKARARSLASTNLEHEQAVNDARSYYSLSARTKNLNMVAVGDVEYLVLNDTVALARK